MKKISIFESSIIGLLVGVVVATYIVFLSGIGGFIGKMLSWASLLPVFDSFHISADNKLIATFLFVVVVFIIYAIIINLIIRKSNKFVALVIFGIILLLIIFVGFDQINGAKNHSALSDLDIPVAAVFKAIQKTPVQYFGQEANGDLNGDGKDDVAFLIPRNDDTNGIIYYMSAALKTDSGHTGTNLIFLGSKVDPQSINIASGTIDLEYFDRSDKKATSTKQFFAQVIDGELIQATTSNQSSL